MNINDIKIGELYKIYRERQLHVYKEPTYKCMFCLKNRCDSYGLILHDRSKQFNEANGFICYILCTMKTSLVVHFDLIEKIS